MKTRLTAPLLACLLFVYSVSWAQEPNLFAKVTLLGEPINTDFKEENPVVSSDGDLFYFSRPGKNGNEVWVSRRGEASWDNPSELALPQKGMVVMQYLKKTDEKNAMLILGTGTGKQCPVYSFLTNKNKWSKPKKIKVKTVADLCGAECCLTSDRKNLIISLAIAGGQGGRDLYMCRALKDGEFEAPINLKDINTEADETSPFISDDGTLYFSSNRKDSKGESDIYSVAPSVESWAGWEEAVNMGDKINTVYNETKFTVTSDKIAYFLREEKGSAKIYEASLSNSDDAAKVKIVGKVLDSQTHLPVAAVVAIETPMGQWVKNVDNNPNTGEYVLEVLGDAKYEIYSVVGSMRSEIVSVNLTSTSGEVEAPVIYFNAEPLKIEPLVEEEEPLFASASTTIKEEPTEEAVAPKSAGKGSQKRRTQMAKVKQPLSKPQAETVKETIKEEPTEEAVAPKSADKGSEKREAQMAKAEKPLSKPQAETAKETIKEEPTAEAVAPKSADKDSEKREVQMAKVEKSLSKPPVATAPIPEKLASNDKILFGVNQFALSSDYFETLDRIAADLAKDSLRTVRLAGYADPSGASSRNLRLSKMRAEAAARYLREKGVQSSQLDVRYYGEENSEEASADEMRRVEISYGERPAAEEVREAKRVVGVKKADVKRAGVDGIRDGVADIQRRVAGIPSRATDIRRVAERGTVGVQLVSFDFNRAVVKESYNAMLDKIAQQAKKGGTIELSGYADRTGSSKYNISLSKRRAEAVAQALKSKGVPAKNIAMNYYGTENPIDGGIKNKNRRVEIRVK